MRKIKKIILRTPILGHAILFVFRARLALGYFRKLLFKIIKWLFRAKETTNFTYNLEELNKRYLAVVIADVLNIESCTIEAYMKELENDYVLKEHISNMITKSELSFLADRDVRFGRRIGWYAFARAIKPKIIIETGVDKGLGSCILAAALMKNKEEGYEGEYYGTDINPDAGYLLSGMYAGFGNILYGDSIDSLKKFEGMIDLFINDSDHSPDYEGNEYSTIAEKLSNYSIILGDNSHVSDKLLEFSLKRGRDFIFFKEKPADHWYPGSGIGISFYRHRKKLPVRE